MEETPRAVVLHKLPTKIDPNSPPFLIQSIRGKGKGFVATRNISIGTLITVDQPIFTGNTRLWIPTKITVNGILDILNRLRVQDQKIFFGLNNAFPNRGIDILYNLIQSNMMILAGDNTGIFLSLARINHACNSNSHAEWNEKTNEMTVYAIRDIQPGEEITISYSRSLPMPREMRRDELKRLWNFECICDLCTLPPKLQQESDERLELVRKIYSSPMLHLQSPLAKLHDICRVLMFLRQDGLYSRFAHHFFDMACDVTALCSDLARCRYFYNCTSITRGIIMGPRHPKALAAEERAKNPSRHSLFGTWTKWLTRLGDVPRNLPREEFQKWLWRINVPPTTDCLLRMYGDFREGWSFRPFKDLPSAGELLPDFFYKSRDCVYPLLRRNWCFLGEIVQVQHGSELVLKVRDKTYKPGDPDILVRFPNVKNGQEYFTGRVPQAGISIAIMYPVKRVLFEGQSTIGLTVSGSSEFTIFPFGLRALMYVSDQIKQHSNPVPNQNVGVSVHKCHNCGKIPASISCAHCEMFFYCSEKCRDAARGEKHADWICRLLQDGNLKILFQADWDEYNGLVAFRSPLAAQQPSSTS